MERALELVAMQLDIADAAIFGAEGPLKQLNREGLASLVGE